jgi:hypothetical protein
MVAATAGVRVGSFVRVLAWAGLAACSTLVVRCVRGCGLLRETNGVGPSPVLWAKLLAYHQKVNCRRFAPPTGRGDDAHLLLRKHHCPNNGPRVVGCSANRCSIRGWHESLLLNQATKSASGAEGPL